MSLPPDQLIFLERAANRRLLDARGTDRVMTKPFGNDDPHRVVFEMLGRPQ